jgi:hypothetical protein
MVVNLIVSVKSALPNTLPEALTFAAGSIVRPRLLRINIKPRLSLPILLSIQSFNKGD